MLKLNCETTSEYPYLLVDGFPVLLEDWPVDADPLEGLKSQDGFRVVFGDEKMCAARCDGYFFRTVECAVTAAKNKIESHEKTGEPLLVSVMVQGFKFNES